MYRGRAAAGNTTRVASFGLTRPSESGYTHATPSNTWGHVMFTDPSRVLPPATRGNPASLRDIGTDTVGCLTRLHREYGECVTYPGSPVTLFAFHPAHNHAVFGRPDEFYIVGPPGPRGSAQRRFGNGLFGLNGPTHQRHRRALMPALQKSAVEGYQTEVVGLIRDRLAGWTPGRTIDLYREMKDLSLEVTGRVLFGLDDFTTVRDVARVFQGWVEDYSAVLFGHLLPCDTPPDAYDRLLSVGEELDGMFRELAAERRASLAPDQHDMLAGLLRAVDAGAFTEDELIGEMHTLVNAAYQTTASALTWTLFLLAQHPDAASAALAEVTGAGPAGPLDRAIKESLRMFPPVVYTARRANHDMPFGGGWVPGGAYVLSSFYVTHRRPEVYPDPDVFRPDRWLNFSPSAYEYLPYGAGARMCMGASFAGQMIRGVVAAVIRRFRLAVVPGTRVDRNSTLTLGVRGELPVEVHAQDGRFAAAAVTGNIHEMVALPAVHRQLVAA